MRESFQNAFLGSLVADAVAMPAHWYYDTDALDRDYGAIRDYVAPKTNHPESILARSHYSPPNEKGDILHDQAKYWGKPNVHYHQFLEAGENTLNLQLAVDVYRFVIRNGGYDADKWVERYIERMRTPQWHRDTYVEECHRAFFTNYARGHSPRECGAEDIHIGGLAAVPAIIAGMDALRDPTDSEVRPAVLEHVALTHKGTEMQQAADAFEAILFRIENGESLREAIENGGNAFIAAEDLHALMARDDRDVVGNVFSRACYLPGAFGASLYLAWKYAGSFTDGVLANVRVGGDNCHRGVVVGALLGAAEGIPGEWLRGLKTMETLRCDSLAPVG